MLDKTLNSTHVQYKEHMITNLTKHNTKHIVCLPDRNIFTSMNVNVTAQRDCAMLRVDMILPYLVKVGWVVIIPC